MLAATLALLGLALSPAPDDPAPDARAAYLDARSKAGRDAHSQVRLALWCEQHGLPAERLRHLALAVLADPAHAAARGLLGQVEDADGHWRRPEEVARRTQQDPALLAALAEYNGRRERAAMTADDQWDLALWCEQHGLEPESKAHLAAVVRLDPSRDAAWKRLGCKKVDGRWMSPERAAAERAENEAQAKADRTWGPRLERIKGQLRDPRKRADARDALAAINDPRAVPAVWRTFARGSTEEQALAAQVLAQIQSPDASKALALIAVGARSVAARRAAAEALPWRDPREFVPLLIGVVRPRIRYEVRHVGGPGSPGELFVQGRGVNLDRVYATPQPADVGRAGDAILGYDAAGLPIAGRVVGYDTQRLYPDAAGRSQLPWMIDPLGAYRDNLTGLPQFLGQALGPAAGAAAQQAVHNQQQAAQIENRLLTADVSLGFMTGGWFDLTRPVIAAVPVGQMLAQARAAAASSEAQLQADVSQIERLNARIDERNGRVLPILRAATEQDFGEDNEAWARWWTESQGYAFRGQSTGTPTITEVVTPAYQPPAPVLLGEGPVVAVRAGHSCFAAGTPVWTLVGPKPIESIQPGDRVLAGDLETGGLDYRPVLIAYHNPPDRTLRVTLDDGGAIVATPIHRFWVAGRGWAMARDLKPGDALRTVGRVARVAAVEPQAVQPVFNLEVAGAHSFFVGDAGLLVHDNSLVEPTPAPFDAVAQVAAPDAEPN
jgi:hypothetical protein